MTAKEKSRELVDKFLCIEDNEDLFCDECGMSEEAAKLCALIAVDEILNTNTLQDRSCGFIPLCEKHTKYWQEVKKELQNV
jgi:hypothetical protein